MDDETKKKITTTPLLRVVKMKDEGLSEDDTCSETQNLSQTELSDQDGGGKDSSSKEFLIPDDELANKIITQVEFYFSDANILKDAFLLKHVRRNKQGFVSIKLITSFKRVKSLTRDFRVVAFCLGKSQKLQVNEEGTKVRRVDPLPDFDETTPSRTVVAVNLPLENPSIESIAELFKQYGEIALIRILRPDKTIPGDIKKYSNKHPEIGTSICGVVEFENHESALKACQMTAANASDWRTGLRVALLASKKREKNSKGEKQKEKNKNKDGKELNMLNNSSKSKEKDSNGTSNVPIDKEKVVDPPVQEPVVIKEEATPEVSVIIDNKVSQDGDKDENNSTCASSQPAVKQDAKGGRRARQKANRKKNAMVDKLAGDGASSGSEMELSTSPSDRDMNWRSSLSPGKVLDRSKLSPASTPGSSPRGSPRSSPGSKRRSFPNKSSPLAEGLSPRQSPRPSPKSSPETMRRNRESPAGEVSQSPSGSPWVQRRMKLATQEKSPLATEASPRGSPLTSRKNLDGIIRQPRGPDGTKGFSGGLGRGKSGTEAN